MILRGTWAVEQWAVTVGLAPKTPLEMLEPPPPGMEADLSPLPRTCGEAPRGEADKQPHSLTPEQQAEQHAHAKERDAAPAPAKVTQSPEQREA